MPRILPTPFPAILALIVFFIMPNPIWGQFKNQWTLPVSSGLQEAIIIYDAVATPTGDILLTGSITKSAPRYIDPFLAKISSDGRLAWFYEIPGKSNDNGWAIATNENGDIYITGDMITALAPDFKEDGINDLKTTKGTEVFVAAYKDNGTNLIFKWATNFPALISEVHSITADRSGNVVIAGSFQKEMTIGTIPLLLLGQSSAFLISLKDKGTSSSLNWGFSFGGAQQGERAFGWGVTTDEEGNVYFSGSFEKNIDLDPRPGPQQILYTAPDIQGFLAKFSAGGIPVWTHHFKGGNSARSTPSHIDYGPDSKIYLTGHYNIKMEFPGGQTTLTTNNYDVFLASFQKNGTLNWASSYGSPSGSNDYASGISVDALGNMAVLTSSNTTAQNIVVLHGNAGNGSIRKAYPLVIDQGIKFNYPEAGDALFYNGQLYLTGIYQHEAANIAFMGDPGVEPSFLPPNASVFKGFASKYAPFAGEDSKIAVKCPNQVKDLYINSDSCSAILPDLTSQVIIEDLRPSYQWCEIAAAASHTLAIKCDGTLWAWGSNNSGELGSGNNTPQNKPTRIGNDSDWKMIAAGNGFSLALKKDGSLWAWGNNQYGQLGRGNQQPSNTPAKISDDWTFIAAGAEHCLAIKSNGSLWAWGNNACGQIGDFTQPFLATPQQINATSKWKYVAGGACHNLAIRQNGTLWAWGNNSYGQLGDNTNTNRKQLVQIGSDSDWWKTAAGENHTYALKENGKLYAWGRNHTGQLGDNSTAQKATPILISNGSFKSVSAGKQHGLAVRMDGALWSWGDNTSGQLGNNGAPTSEKVPTQKGNSYTWSSVVAGADFSFGLQDNAKLLGWGKNANSQLGNGYSSNQLLPVAVLQPNNISIKQIPSPGASLSYGKNAIVLSIADETGTIGLCAFDVEVLDTIAAVAKCKDVTVSLDSTGLGTIIPEDVYDPASGNCSPVTLRLNADNFACAQQPPVNTPNYALSFDGVNDYVNISPPFSQTNAYTIELWFRSEKDCKRNYFSRIWGWSNSGIEIGQCGPNLSFWNGYQWKRVSSNVSFGDWHHLAIVRENPTYTFYLDGEPVYDFQWPKSVVVSQDFQLGGRVAVDGGGVELWKGQIDELRIWNYSRSASDIKTNYLLPLTGVEPGLIGYWDMNDGPGKNSVVDKSASKKTGSLINMDANASWVEGPPLANSSMKIELLVTSNRNGSTATCSSTLTLADAIPPQAKCKDVVLPFDNNGTIAITPQTIDNGSKDNCAIASLSVNIPTIVCGSNVKPPFTQVVTLTATDQQGNTHSCTSTITVVDMDPPVVKCKNVNPILPANGQLTITPAMIDNGSTDNCSVSLAITSGKTSFTCEDSGKTFPVELTGTDPSGLSAKCTAQVKIIDEYNTCCKPFSFQVKTECTSVPSGSITFNVYDCKNGPFEYSIDGGITYMPGPNPFTIANLPIGHYKIYVKDAKGQSVSQNLTLCPEQIQNPTDSCTLTVKPSTHVKICPGKSVQLEVSGATVYKWYNATGLSCDNCPNPVLSGNVANAYVVYGYNNAADLAARKPCGRAVVFVDIQPVCNDNTIIGCCFSNYGASVYVSDNTYLNIYCNLLNEVSGNAISLQKGTFENKKDIHVLLDWINNGYNNLFTTQMGKSVLFGSIQKMRGKHSTHFFDLSLEGNGRKEIWVDEYAFNNLDLTVNELATLEHIFHVENQAGTAIQRNNGFVSTDGKAGYLQRLMNNTDFYLFPMGSIQGPFRYRPLEMGKAASGDRYKVRFNNYSPSLDGLNNLAPNVYSVNSKYYHQIGHSVPTAPVLIRSYFDKTNDGNFQSIVHWETDPPSEWRMAPAMLFKDNSPALSYVESDGLQDFDGEPYSLSQAGFYVGTGNFGNGANTGSGSGVSIIVNGTSGQSGGGLGQNNNTGGNTPVYPSPVQGSYEIIINSGDCSVPGKITFDADNSGLISNVKYVDQTDNTHTGALSPELYSIDIINKGLILNSTPPVFVCGNSIAISLGSSGPFVLKTTEKDMIVSNIPNGITLQKLVVKNESVTVLSKNNPTAVIDLSGITAGHYLFELTIGINNTTDIIKGHFIKE